MALITQERIRGMEDEGFDAAHDDAHTKGELASAAASYAQQAVDQVDRIFMPERWPWERRWWKPSNDPVRDLVKAGALIAAEIDRLQRIKKERVQS